MKLRQAFQLGELVTENTDHFTTLTDVNQFIVQFYEFVMSIYHIIKEISCEKSSKGWIYLTVDPVSTSLKSYAGTINKMSIPQQMYLPKKFSTVITARYFFS